MRNSLSTDHSLNERQILLNIAIAYLISINNTAKNAIMEFVVLTYGKFHARNCEKYYLQMRRKGKFRGVKLFASF
jgi:hypothetical protein